MLILTDSIDTFIAVLRSDEGSRPTTRGSGRSDDLVLYFAVDKQMVWQDSVTIGGVFESRSYKFKSDRGIVGGFRTHTSDYTESLRWLVRQTQLHTWFEGESTGILFVERINRVAPVTTAEEPRSCIYPTPLASLCKDLPSLLYQPDVDNNSFGIGFCPTLVYYSGFHTEPRDEYFGPTGFVKYLLVQLLYSLSMRHLDLKAEKLEWRQNPEILANATLAEFCEIIRSIIVDVWPQELPVFISIDDISQIDSQCNPNVQEVETKAILYFLRTLCEQKSNCKVLCTKSTLDLPLQFRYPDIIGTSQTIIIPDHIDIDLWRARLEPIDPKILKFSRLGLNEYMPCRN